MLFGVSGIFLFLPFIDILIITNYNNFSLGCASRIKTAATAATAKATATAAAALNCYSNHGLESTDLLAPADPACLGEVVLEIVGG